MLHGTKRNKKRGKEKEKGAVTIIKTIKTTITYKQKKSNRS